MSTFADTEQYQRKLIKRTKFACIFNLGDKFAVKAITTDFIVAPHNHVAEKSILHKLRESVHSISDAQTDNSQYVIELLDDRKLEDEVELLFPFYPMSLYELMRSQYKRVDHQQPKKKFNPYYDLSNGAKGAESEAEPTKVQYKNCFDINKDAHSYFLQIARGLEYIHSCGIIHRDVKPQNTMVDPITNQLKITDFGISYDTHSAQQTTNEPTDRKITDVSTSFYKAPELLLSVKNYGYEVDIWGLLILVSQWFQTGADVTPNRHNKMASELGDDFYIPALVEDGSQDGETGSDVRLLMCIFERFGVPKLADWKEVEQFGSEGAFVGLFGAEGDGKYMQYCTHEQQLERLQSMLPRLGEISDASVKSRILETLLQMTPFQASRRISSAGIVAALQ